MITAYRTTRHGAGIEAYEVVELLKDGVWVHGNTFYETDDYMSTNMGKYISSIKNKIQDERPKFYRAEIRNTAFVRDRSTKVDFGHRRDHAMAFCQRNTDFHVVSYYKEEN
jgi:hypothetical protein